MPIEKRGLARVPMDTSVLFTVNGRLWQETRSKDISPTGIFLISGEPMETGQVVLLKFRLPNLKHTDPIRAQAEVMRCMVRKGRQSGYGLRFLLLSLTQYQLVSDFVRRILGVSPLADGSAPDGHRAEQASSIFAMDRLVREAAADHPLDRSGKGTATSTYEAPDIWPWIRRVLVFGAIILGIFACYHLSVRVVDLVSKFARLL